MISKLGKWVLHIAFSMAKLVGILIAAFKNIPNPLQPGSRPIAQVFLKQVYFTGFESLKVIIIISLSIGTVLITQIISLVGSGNESLIGKVLVWVVIREIGPLLTAIIVIARSGTAIATELGFMKINGEIDSIESLGISSDQYLIMPRIFGVTSAVIFLTIYFEIFSILGGFFVASLGWHVSFEKFSHGILSSLTVLDLSMSAVKSLFFGLFLSTACCQHGLAVGKSTTQIPQAATKGVMQSLFLVFILDGIITVVSLALKSGLGN
jgi:phospholipid/cholesterol/gamma-HCH transport system permease protein